MQNTFKYINKSREIFFNLVDGLSIEQLNKISDGFNNNIAWNFGHIIVTAPLLCYVRSGVKPDLAVSFKEKYQKGSKPGSFILQEEMNELKVQLFSTIRQIEEDVTRGVFAHIQPFSTETFGFEMNSIEEILICIQSHDALHYGYALAQRKLVI